MFRVIKNEPLSREMDQQLREITALPEDPDWLPSTHRVVIVLVIPVLKDYMPSSDFHGLLNVHAAHIHIHTFKNAHMH